ncbi:MAG: hypothetical protein MZV70_03035 [Desulfobacterales bacterium]|nr:hypothetical protein [Desulfobacterales bacterium]
MLEPLRDQGGGAPRAGDVHAVDLQPRPFLQRLGAEAHALRPGRPRADDLADRLPAAAALGQVRGQLRAAVPPALPVRRLCRHGGHPRPAFSNTAPHHALQTQPHAAGSAGMTLASLRRNGSGRVARTSEAEPVVLSGVALPSHDTVAATRDSLT